MKQCAACRKKGVGPKPESAFSKCAQAADGLQYTCKECHAAYRATNKDKVRATRKTWEQNNRVRVRAYQRQRAKRNPLAVTAKSLKEYGLTLAEYGAIYAAQQGRCAICSAEVLSQITETRHTSRVRVAHVDHCHATGAVRGLLCFHCNVGLGKFRDNEQLLISAVRYLRENGAVLAAIRRRDDTTRDATVPASPIPRLRRNGETPFQPFL